MSSSTPFNPDEFENYQPPSVEHHNNGANGGATNYDVFRLGNFEIEKTDLILYILAFFLPPLSVAARTGFKSTQFVIAIVAWFFWHFPGTLYAFYIVYDSSYCTGSANGINSRKSTLFGLGRGGITSGNGFDVENFIHEVNDDEHSDNETAEHDHEHDHGASHVGVYQDHEPPAYESNSGGGAAAAAAGPGSGSGSVDNKALGDNKIQHD